MNNETDEERPDRKDPAWSRRRATSIKLAWAFGALALIVYLVAIWKLRPI
ncbi:MAG: hypothetical protein ACK4UX_01425 [Thiobacillus sp.]